MSLLMQPLLPIVISVALYAWFMTSFYYEQLKWESRNYKIFAVVTLTMIVLAIFALGYWLGITV